MEPVKEHVKEHVKEPDKEPVKEPDKSLEACTICIENLEKNITELECGHIFHSKCIIEYAATTANKRIPCPICRAHVIEIQPCIEPLLHPINLSYTPHTLVTDVPSFVINNIDYVHEQMRLDARACCTTILFAFFLGSFIYFTSKDSN